MTSPEQRLPVALKEWAVAVKALSEGEQIMVLRKGGIAEETRDFQLRSPQFYLLPAYEHQKPELLKAPYQSGIQETLQGYAPGGDTVKINAYAEVVDDIEIRDQDTLDKVREFHIWTDTFAEERLKWKRTKPLHLLLLRVYVLEETEIPQRPAYTGCKSWVTLEDGIPARAFKPVLDDDIFAAKVQEIRLALGL
ncbi:hypothetical protein FHS18_000339 [Paenibacillus phyllosphaerae]|uniref:DUF1802 family protein n=1 Tax=Paenibacillus phyllosphaerae TaxID=274593 RepID=A0A7W5FKN5_9BACL|nr:DUF1802 family protein [Paenibacillus phyllosphaerae]MBB3108311.1 hypothetical protein [Paenibacillus phyllosphaerae]